MRAQRGLPCLRVSTSLLNPALHIVPVPSKPGPRRSERRRGDPLLEPSLEGPHAAIEQLGQLRCGKEGLQFPLGAVRHFGAPGCLQRRLKFVSNYPPHNSLELVYTEVDNERLRPF